MEGLLDIYGSRFKYAAAVKHPANLEGEIIGKGGNITYAGRALQKYLKKTETDPTKVIGVKSSVQLKNPGKISKNL